MQHPERMTCDWGLGFGVWGWESGFGVWGLGFGAWGWRFNAVGFQAEAREKSAMIQGYLEVDKKLA